MSHLVVTGAAGFLGRAICAAAERAGHEVTAVTRKDVDLATGHGLEPVFAKADAVIHAAAGSGDDAAHARDTLQATEHVIAAMPDDTARLVLVSSFSVYAFDGLPDWTLLDETAPTDPDGKARDAYARAKIGQEKRAFQAAQTGGLDLWVARPGAIYGAGRLSSARLGWNKAGRWLCPGTDAPVPAIHVDSCAEALVRAATVDDQGWPEDLPVLEGRGHVRLVNLVDPNPPTQAQWLAAMGEGAPVKLPRKPLMRLANLLELLADLSPHMGRVIPGALRPQTLAARFKPLHYSVHRLQDRLGHRPDRSFDEAMAASKETSAS